MIRTFFTSIVLAAALLVPGIASAQHGGWTIQNPISPEGRRQAEALQRRIDTAMTQHGVGIARNGLSSPGWLLTAALIFRSTESTLPHLSAIVDRTQDSPDAMVHEITNYLEDVANRLPNSGEGEYVAMRANQIRSQYARYPRLQQRSYLRGNRPASNTSSSQARGRRQRLPFVRPYVSARVR